MKTFFQMGLPSRNMFWMGQSSGTITVGSLDYAMDLYNKIARWDNSTNRTNQAALLGSDYDQYQSQLALAQSLIGDVTPAAATLDNGGTLTSDQNTKANQFLDAVGFAWGIIAEHPAPTSAISPAAAAPAPQAPPLTPLAPVAPATPGSSRMVPTGVPVAPSAAAKAGAAAPVAASTGPDPLLIGGIAVGGLAILAFALRK